MLAVPRSHSDMDVPEIITCVDCGQKAHRLTYPPEEGWQDGDVVAYRCSGCMDRWDLVLGEGDEHGRNPEEIFDFRQWLVERGQQKQGNG